MGIFSFFKSKHSNIAAQQTFNNWLIQIIQNEKPESDIIAFNFGIFQTEKGYSLYLIGTKTYDSENDDWATGFGDFTPKNKYLVLPPEEFQGQDWENIQKQVVELISKFMMLEVFKNSFLDKSNAITTGFDDGDLIRIK